MSLKFKVCGMRDSKNIQDVLELQPDYMGFIFYEKSPRFIENYLSQSLLHNFPEVTKKVGVFVNAAPDFVLEKSKLFGLDLLQLHGNESPEYCQKLNEKGLIIMKAFSVDQSFDFDKIESYKNSCSMFLFDTKAKGGYGGHGKTFDWSLLKKYKLDIPFLLAGGIDLDNIENLKTINNPSFIGLDVNSRFEISPAQKDIKKLKQLKKLLEGL